VTVTAPSGPDGPVAVRTSRGTLLGSSERGLVVFRGIRYARPPVGERRFRPPEPADPWEGSMAATEFGPACPQGFGASPPPGAPARPPVFGGLFGPGAYGMSEDCLSLNVWTPACDTAKRPVLVFVHGGAFRLGTSTAATYDGSALCARGDVVVVTLNYRVGALGFMHLPELGAVNLGLLDQVAALEWVAAEIEAFGGDPSAVTVFGESAGAKSIECLLAMPAARGLFRAAILQSTYAPAMDPGVAREFARSVTEAAGVGDDPPALLTLPVPTILAAVTEVQMRSGPNLFGGSIGPVADGSVLPAEPIAAVREGSVPPVPMIVGTNLDEARLFGAIGPGGLAVDEAALVQRLDALLAGAGGRSGDQVAEAYRQFRSGRGQGASPTDVLYAAQTDRMFRQHSIALAEAHSSHQRDVWMFLFTWPSEIQDGVLGACHALELPFVFGTLDGPTAELTGTDEAAQELSATLQSAWLGFAGSCAPPAELDWPRYEPGRRATLELGRTVGTLEAPEEPERLFWSDARAPAG
jgi:para-nitrobenzyl esterase